MNPVMLRGAYAPVYNKISNSIYKCKKCDYQEKEKSNSQLQNLF